MATQTQPLRVLLNRVAEEAHERCQAALWAWIHDPDNPTLRQTFVDAVRTLETTRRKARA